MFPKPSGGPNGEAGYPMIRLVAIIVSGSRSVIEAVFGSDKVGELLRRPRGPGPAAGDAFVGGPKLRHLQVFRHGGRNRGRVPDPGQDQARGHEATATARLRDGSYLANAGGVQVRVIEAAVRITTEAGTRTGEYRLITTLLDPSGHRRNSWWPCTTNGGRSKRPTAN